MAYSTNGVSWTLVTFGSNFNNTDVTYGASGFFATQGTNSGKKSTNGSTWTDVTIGGGGAYDGIRYGNGIYVTVSGSGEVASSSNLSTWTITSVPGIGSKIEFGNGVFVATTFTNTSPGVYYSSNGTTWTFASVPVDAAITGTGGNAVFGNGRFLILSTTGSKNSAQSTDGINWIPYTLTGYPDWAFFLGR